MDQNQISITPEDIAFKKVVGRVGDDKVFEIRTTGGWNVISVMKSGKPRIIGCGSHKRIARAIAEKNEDVEWTELSKGDYLAPEDYQHLLPYWEDVTRQLMEAQEDDR